MRKALLFLPALIGLLGLSTGCPPIDTTPPNGTTPPSGTIPQAILDMEMDTHVAINAERAAELLGALTMDEGLRAVARAHSQDMIDRGFFDHINPDGDDAGDRLADAGITYAIAGENIAWNQGFPDPQNAYYFTQVFTDPAKSSGTPYAEVYTYGPIAMEDR